MFISYTIYGIKQELNLIRAYSHIFQRRVCLLALTQEERINELTNYIHLLSVHKTVDSIVHTADTCPAAHNHS